MIRPQTPLNEIERLQALSALKILDSPEEERFDRVTRMAKRLFGVPISLISLVDKNRQWFKSKQGLEASETPREVSFCGHALNEDKVFIVSDAINDVRFHDNPLVTKDPNIRFYAGYPIKISPGVSIGTLCLIDTKPRVMTQEDIELLCDLGKMVEQEIKSIQMATLDELTMVSNRRGFTILAEHSKRLCRRNKLSMSVIMFDLNKFKHINDNYGHNEGDQALRLFAQEMLKTFRESDVIGRLGGDEFAVLLTDTKKNDIDLILKRFKHNLHKITQTKGKPYTIECCAGIATFPFDSSMPLNQMLEQADAVMYKNKNALIRAEGKTTHNI